MKFKQYILLVACTIGFVTINFAQHRRVPIKNGIGIQGGLTQFDLFTDNFETKPGNGWIAGGSATVELPHKFYNMSYSIQLSENTIGISSRPFAFKLSQILAVLLSCQTIALYIAFPVFLSQTTVVSL